MVTKKKFFFLILLPLFFSCTVNNDQEVTIVFENPPTLKQEQELVINLNNHIPKRNLSEFLNNQNWIDTYLIKRHAFKPLEIFIKSKEPKYIWNEQFYLDRNLSKFLYFGEYPHLVHLDMPIELVDEWLKVEDKIFEVAEAFNLKISSVSYSEAEGWYFHTKNNLRINIGSDLSSRIFKKHRQ